MLGNPKTQQGIRNPPKDSPSYFTSIPNTEIIEFLIELLVVNWY